MSHTSRPVTSKLFQFTALTLALALAGCGGGDGDTVDSIAPPPDTGVQQPGSGGSGGGDQSFQEINIISATLYNTENNIINSVGLDGAFYKIRIVDQNNQPVVNAKVTFDVDADGIDLSQTTSGSVLTGSEGMAQIFLKPSSAEVSGAYTISATASYKQQTATTNTTFSVQATNVSLSSLTADMISLPSGGQTPISLKVTDGAGKALSGIVVNFNSSCGQVPEQVASDSDGVVKAVFKAINTDTTLCSGNVRISATAGNSTQSTALTVAAAEATSIIYTSSDVNLGIRGSGSSSTGEAEFTVYSGATTLANARVRVSLEKSPFGLTFGPNRNQADYIATTDANGQIVVPIFPGTTPGPVEIEVTLVDDPLINALSKNITVASSRVTQTGLSLSWEKNVLDWSYDGDSTKIFARMVDRNGNAVPDGTVINFTAEGGKVTSSCATVDGECPVTFSTQNPRPGDGRVSILAVAEGEKDYIDMNQNNAWDEGIDVLVHNIGDTFRDDNENGTFELGEFTYPMTTSANGQCENNLDRYINLKFPTLSNLKRLQYKANYIGEFVSPNKANTCNTDLDAVVRYQGITLLADSEAKFTIIAPQINAQTQKIYAANSFISIRTNSGGFYDLNPMPSGTTISGSAVDNTDSSPVDIRVDSAGKPNTYKITFTGGVPGDVLKFTIDGTPYSATDDNNDGIYIFPELQRDTRPTPEDIKVVSEEGSCSAEISAGDSKVPANVATGRPGNNLGTTTTFKLKNCSADDEFTVMATTPRRDVTKYTYTIN